MRSFRWLIALSTCLGCHVPGIELDHRECPCAEESDYFCDTARNVCERRMMAAAPLFEDSFEDAPGSLEGRVTGARTPWTTIEGTGRVEAGAVINDVAPFTAYVDIGATNVRLEAEITLPPTSAPEAWTTGTVVAAVKGADPDITDGVVARVDHSESYFTIRLEDFVGRRLRTSRTRQIFDVLDESGGRILLVQIVSETGVLAYIDGHFEASLIVLPLAAPLTGKNIGITVNDAAGAVGVRWEQVRVFANIEDTTPPSMVENLRITDGLIEWTGATDNLELWGYYLSRSAGGSGWEGPTLATGVTSYRPGADEGVYEGYWPGQLTDAYVLAFDIAGNVTVSSLLRYTIP